MSKGLWKPSSTGSAADLGTATVGRVRDGASDLQGRVWTRLHDGTNPVSSSNPLPVTSNGTVIAPVSGDSSNQEVTTAAAVSFTTVSGRRYIVSVTSEMTMLSGSAPTATTGMILPAGSMVGPIQADSTTFQLIATTSTGRASVVQVDP